MRLLMYGLLLTGCSGLQQSLAQAYYSRNGYYEPETLWEAGFSAGAINCLTDLGGNKGAGRRFIKDLNPAQTQFCGSLFISATRQSLFSFRIEAFCGQVCGSDDVLKNAGDAAIERYRRHLSFRSIIAELSGTASFHPLFLYEYDDGAYPLLSPYIVAGIGCFYYNPQARLNNGWTDLRPLHTEGQGFSEFRGRPDYKPVTWCLPAGAGIEYDAGGLVTLRLEMVYRFTGTDYLDDVSRNYIDPALFAAHLPPAQANLAMQLADRRDGSRPAQGIRGNPKNKDAYMLVTLKAALVLNRKKSGPF